MCAVVVDNVAPVDEVPMCAWSWAGVTDIERTAVLMDHCGSASVRVVAVVVEVTAAWAMNTSFMSSGRGW